MKFGYLSDHFSYYPFSTYTLFHDKANTALSQQMSEMLNQQGKKTELIDIESFPSDELTADALSEKGRGYLFCFDYFSYAKRQEDLPAGTKKIFSLKRSIEKANLYTCLSFMDVKENMDKIFGTPPKEVISLNEALISRGKQAKTVRIQDDNGTDLHILLNHSTWQSIDGIAIIPGDFLPSEVLAAPLSISGKFFFTGSILSGVPIGIKHGIIKDPIQVIFQDNKVIAVDCANAELKADLELVLFNVPESSVPIEVGIGTNTHIPLTGDGFVWEERHAGAHLGIGGKNKSNHTDFIFAHSKIWFDDQLIFNNGYFSKL